MLPLRPLFELFLPSLGARIDAHHARDESLADGGRGWGIAVYPRFRRPVIPYLFSERRAAFPDRGTATANRCTVITSGAQSNSRLGARGGRLRMDAIPPPFRLEFANRRIAGAQRALHPAAKTAAPAAKTLPLNFSSPSLTKIRKPEDQEEERAGERHCPDGYFRGE